MKKQKRGTLHQQTLELLREKSRTTTLVQIHDETNIPFHWLSAFKQEVMRNPSVNRVQKLYEHLTGKALAV